MWAIERATSASRVNETRRHVFPSKYILLHVIQLAGPTESSTLFYSSTGENRRHEDWAHRMITGQYTSRLLGDNCERAREIETLAENPSGNAQTVCDGCVESNIEIFANLDKRRLNLSNPDFRVFPRDLCGLLFFLPRSNR